MTDDLDYDALDPGVRDAVRHLRARGFDTTDSGDGASKFRRVCGTDAEAEAAWCALPFPHVFAVLADPARLVAESNRLLAVLEEREPGQWRVEGSYCPNEGTALLLARKADVR